MELHSGQMQVNKMKEKRFLETDLFKCQLSWAILTRKTVERTNWVHTTSLTKASGVKPKALGQMTDTMTWLYSFERSTQKYKVQCIWFKSGDFYNEFVL